MQYTEVIMIDNLVVKRNSNGTLLLIHEHAIR